MGSGLELTSELRSGSMETRSKLTFWDGDWVGGDFDIISTMLRGDPLGTPNSTETAPEGGTRKV